MPKRHLADRPTTPAWQATSPREGDPAWLVAVSDSVMGLDYGTVQVVVQDGEVVQVERTERVRFDFRSHR